MAATYEMTASSQLRSANCTSEIRNHTGEENRARFRHANEDIDTSKSHLNVSFDFHDRDELLEEHYGEKVRQHDEKNNSAKRRWGSVEGYLKTFEGKKVKVGGVETKHERWATASQISYVGSKDSMNPFLKMLEQSGASQEEIRSAYAKGYENYVLAHNEKFKTLPIYHSDIHFDETTPHGHDAIVVMGKGKAGKRGTRNPSDSINTALSDHYNDFSGGREGRSERFRKYRAENDSIMYNNVMRELVALGTKYGAFAKGDKISFLRTGEKGSVSTEEYKRKKDFDKDVEEKMNNALEEVKKEYEGLDAERAEFELEKASFTVKRDNDQKSLDDRETSLNERESQIESAEKAQADLLAKQVTEHRERLEREEREHKQRLAEREEKLKDKESRLNAREFKITEREEVHEGKVKRTVDMAEYVQKKSDEVYKRSKTVLEVEQGLEQREHLVNESVLAILKDDPNRQKSYELIKKNGVRSYPTDKIVSTIHGSLSPKSMKARLAAKANQVAPFDKVGIEKQLDRIGKAPKKAPAPPVQVQRENDLEM